MGIAGPVHTKDVIFSAYAKKKVPSFRVYFLVVQPHWMFAVQFPLLAQHASAQYMGLMEF